MSQYIFLLAPIIGWLFSQLIKLSLNKLNSGQLNLGDIFSSGNMPSSHVCGATALTTALAIKEGLSSPVLALSFVFTVLIAYDSVGVRRTAADGAAAINALNKKMGLHQAPLHIYKGHTLWEVIGGVVLGLIVAVTLCALL